MTTMTARSPGYEQLRHPLEQRDRLPEWMAVGPHLGESRKTAAEELSERFNLLADRWRAETAFLSSVEDMCIHEAYQRIIGLGQPAVPLLLRGLDREPDHWFWALQAITGQVVHDEGTAGNVAAMARAWTEWGRRNGYLK